MSLLLRQDTLKELFRLLAIQLKSDGHAKYSDSSKKIFAEFSLQYRPEISQSSGDSLHALKENCEELFAKLEVTVVNKEVRDYTKRIKTEIDRIIAIINV